MRIRAGCGCSFQRTGRSQCERELKVLRRILLRIAKSFKRLSVVAHTFSIKPILALLALFNSWRRVASVDLTAPAIHLFCYEISRYSFAVALILRFEFRLRLAWPDLERHSPLIDRRVVITGIGLTTSIGRTREAVWQALQRGECNIRRLADLSKLPDGLLVATAAIDGEYEGQLKNIPLCRQTASEALKTLTLILTMSIESGLGARLALIWVTPIT